MLSGGCGREIASWIAKGYTNLDMFGYDIKRYNPDYTNDSEWIKTRSHEAYAKNYSIVFPKDEPLAGRTDSIRSPFFKKLVAGGMNMQERHQWERPGWCSTNGKAPELKEYDFYGAYPHTPKHKEYEYEDRLVDDYTFGFPKNHDAIGAESIAAREGVVAYDQSYFGKFFISGKDALKALQWICTNDVDKPIGSTIYTNMCNEAGKSECDLTVSRIGESEFYIAAGGGSRTHDWCHIRNIVQDKGYDLKMEDKTKDYSMLSLQGRHSKDIMEALCPKSSFENDKFPFSTTQVVKIDGVDVRAIRLTFVGELGWELHIPNDSAEKIYDQVVKAGSKYDLKMSGYRAIDSLSAEKGYLHWHEDIRPDDTPIEANIGFVCKLKQNTILRTRSFGETARRRFEEEIGFYSCA
eukprot:UN25929